MKFIYIVIAFLFLSVPTVIYSAVEIKADGVAVECMDQGIKVSFDLFIRNTSDTPLSLGNQNYRIHFDLENIISESFFITEVGVVSNVGFDDNGNVYLFDPPNLTGSIFNVLSLNLNHSGGNIGFPLQSDWTKLARIEFITDGSEDCFSSDIKPVSNNVAESYFSKFSNNEYEIVEIESFQNFSLCLSEYCEICPHDIDLVNGDDDYSGSSQYVTIEAGNIIQANNKISDDANVTYSAKNGVILYYGFEVLTPSLFEIQLDGCQVLGNDSGN